MSAKKTVEKDTKICQGKDVFERMNFLYQASQSIASKNVHLSSYYGDIMTRCSKKAVLRIDPEVKRTLCKSCQTPLIPGKTARVRTASKPAKSVKWHCLICGKSKKFPTAKRNDPWWDNPKALVQFFDYAPKPNGKDDAISEGKSCSIEPVHHDNKESTKCDASVSIK